LERSFQQASTKTIAVLSKEHFTVMLNRFYLVVVEPFNRARTRCILSREWTPTNRPEGKRTLGRPRRRWEDNIEMDLQEVRGSCWDWMELSQDRDRWRGLVSTVRNLRVPKMRGISSLAAEPVSFSRRTLLHGVSK
jgi:hypothetical protein